MHAEYAAHAGKMQESVANMEANNLRYQEQIDNLIEEVSK